MTRTALLLSLALAPAAGALANTFTAAGESSVPVVMQDEKGPFACGHRTMMVVDNSGGNATTADLQLITAWADDKKAFFGMMKLRVTRNRLTNGGQSFQETDVGQIERFSISTNDFGATASPYQGVSASSDPGYYLASSEPEGMTKIVMPDDDGSHVRILSFLDKKQGNQENIRFKVNLSKDDALTFLGCIRTVLNRASATLQPASEATDPAQ